MNAAIAASHSDRVILACLASPGIAAYTSPSLSAIANMVTQATRVAYGSDHTVEAVMLLNSLV